MKAIISLVALSFLLAACSPSKQDILRQQQLAQKRAEAARLEAQERALAAQTRLANAHQNLRHNAAPAQTPAQALKLLESTEPNKIYYFTADLQADKYNYSQETQSFAIVGLRVVHKNRESNENFSTLLEALKRNNALELILAKETQLNNLHQLIEKPNTARVAAFIPNIKTDRLLLTRNQKWSWNSRAFNDLDWLTSPEIAWEITSNYDFKMQVGLRFCSQEPCLVKHSYQDHPTYTYQADVMSILIYRSDNKEVVAEFINDRP